MIGLCAQSRMGKDTVAALIMELRPEYKTIAFGNELKKMISSYFEIPLQEIEEYKTTTSIHPNIQISMRKALQLIGETMRQVSTDVWVTNALKNLDDHKCIITDVRHSNEMKCILNKNGTLILLGRSKYLSEDPHPSESGLQHAIKWFLTNTSESFIVVKNQSNVPDELQKFSYFLRNDGSLQDLKRHIYRLCREL